MVSVFNQYLLYHQNDDLPFRALLPCQHKCEMLSCVSGMWGLPFCIGADVHQMSGSQGAAGKGPDSPPPIPSSLTCSISSSSSWCVPAPLCSGCSLEADTHWQWGGRIRKPNFVSVAREFLTLAPALVMFGERHWVLKPSSPVGALCSEEVNFWWISLCIAYCCFVLFSENTSLSSPAVQE